MVDCITDLSASVGIITETWLSDGDSLEEDLEGLTLGTGLKMICKNRETNDRGFSHGGVAVVFRDTAASFKTVKLHNPDKIEVLLVGGTIHGIQRKVAVVACYIPPNYSTARGLSLIHI